MHFQLLSFCIFLLSASRSSTLRGSKLRERELRGLLCRRPPLGPDLHQQTARSSAAQHTAMTCFSFLCFLSFPSPSLAPQKRDPQQMRRSWRLEKGGGAAAGPLAGECVPHEGERARRRGDLRWCRFASLGRWVRHA
jgi:hypothetical protein